MSVGIGFNKSKSKESGTRTGKSVTTPDVPQWLQDSIQGLTTKVGGLADADPSSYIAGADPLQSWAATSASKLSGSPWNFDAALDVTRGVAGADTPSLLDNLSAYQNPYKQQVVDALSADFDANAGKTRAAQKLNLAREGAFGGSGAAITQSATEGELARARDTGMSKTLSDMFMNTAGLAGQDADRKLADRSQKLAAASQMGALSSAFDANNRANIGTQADIGATLQALTQKAKQAPLDLASFLTGSYGDISSLLQALIGQTTTEDEQTTGSAKTTGFNANASYKYGG